MEILENKENKLLGRKEIIVKLPVEKETPSRKHLMSEIQKQFTAAADEIIIERVVHPFGTKYAKVYVRIYDNAQGALKEPAYKRARGTKTEKKAEEGKK
ncbi:MAG: hypothetical protein AABX01_06470 [Candidatus Micrarchaeota archaeon]